MLIEKSNEEIQKEKTLVFEEEKTDLLNSLYILFQKFDEGINKDNFNKISDYIISITSLLLIIEKNNFISVDEVDQKLDKSTTYKTFKTKNASMKLIKNANINLNKTNYNLNGGGFLQLAILGVGIASTLVNLTSAAIGTTVGALKEDRMVKGFEGSLEKAKAFKTAMENRGGSCAFNSELQTKDQTEFNKTVGVFKYTHAPEFVAQDIDDYVKKNPGAIYEDYIPGSHRYNTRGINQYNSEYNITQNVIGNDYIMRYGHKFFIAHNEQNFIKNWEYTLEITKMISKNVYSNWETSTNAKPGDICIFFMAFREYDGGHAFNGLVRKINEEYKVGAIDSNDYTNLIDIDSNDNIVPGKAYKRGWIRVEEGFFTPEEEKELGNAVIKTDNPLLSVFDRYKEEVSLFGYNLYKYRDWNNPTSEFSITFENNVAEENYVNFPTPTTGNMAIVDFGVAEFQAFIEAKNIVNNVASNYFEAIEKHPGSTFKDYIVNDNFFQHKTTFGGKKTTKKRTKKTTKKKTKKRTKKRTKRTKITTKK
jgi:hypothetical protein